VIRPGRIMGKSIRFSALLAGAAVISMGIFALVPLLLRQTSCQPHFPRVSYALLIPIRPELPPDSMQPEQDLEPPPEAPEPPEPEIEADTPDIPEIKPPEVEPPETAAEITRETLDMPPLEPWTLAPPAPDPPPLHAVALSALPVQSTPMNLKVNLRVGRAPAPRAVARPAVPQKPAATQTRFGLHEVDQKPVSLATLKPDYPFRAKRMGIEGYVTVQFLVDRSGRTQDLTIVAAEPTGIFDQTVRKAVPRWRFKPGKKAGRWTPGSR
jgi:protein TonB